MNRRSFSTLLLAGSTALAQSPLPAIEGEWQGAIEAGANRLRLVLNISKASDGLYFGTLTSVDQGGAKIPVDAVQVAGDKIRFEVKAVNGVYEGSIEAGGGRWKGTWSQGGRPVPLEFSRVAKPVEAPAAKPEAASREPFPFGLPLDLQIPVAPTPFAAGGKSHLVYELHLTNFSGRDLLLRRIDVMHGGATLATFEGADLNGILTRPGDDPSAGVDKRSIGPGRRAIAYLWITLDGAARIPASIRHRIVSGAQSVEGSAIAMSAVKPPLLGPPLRGGNWFAGNGPGNSSIHRRALLAAGGRATISQRFAIDWVQTGAGAGATFTGDAKENKNYHAYGSDALAVADAVVAAVKDGIPQNIPGSTSRAVPITPETIAGNHVVLDLGGGRFAFYMHLQPGSPRVKSGDRVSRGQVLGLVGNSGNSTEPHLHFQVTDGSSPLGSEGVPWLLEAFEILDKGGAGDQRRAELPLQNARVRFGASR